MGDCVWVDMIISQAMLILVLLRLEDEEEATRAANEFSGIMLSTRR